jgi:hypothetical protein
VVLIDAVVIKHTKRKRLDWYILVENGLNMTKTEQDGEEG